ncbi:HNH endonuclease signature motif containing protein [Rhodococcus sp. ARC_M6]|uniref:HNH endonuclease signature motif containing protein n=1 Tax=Rhodococcus sp. ARC_M6 TaxID=2928852 RepID=UPI001FB520FF|nr:HNH endonuclease signature motif containing protein [Rhodococcus sp. ARC_M6]MCJ0904280.1 HNH endonuclease [Rhodococcus sp. ARC_M6]
MGNREAWQLDSEGLKIEVLDLVHARHGLQSRMVHLVVEMFARDALPDTGFRAIAQWLHRSTNLEIGECSQLVSLARLFMLEPVVAQSFHDGDIDALKARQVAQFCQHPPKSMHTADIEKARDILLDLASKKVSDCDAVRAAIRRIEKKYGNRDDGVPVGEDSERNEFYASKGLYGRVSVKGDLDAVNGARLIALLSGLSNPTPEIDGVKDARTPALRRADGFCEMLRRFEMAGLGPVEGGVKPHLTITATAKDLTDLQALKDLLPSTEELGYAITNWAGPISLDSARMLACDCTVTRILLDQNGVPLNHGLDERTATVPQRRALTVRDGGCAFPGCGTPPGWCDAHHIVHWMDSGPTDFDNLILLCGHHHRLLHHTEWRVEIGDDRKTRFYPPMSVDPYRDPIPGNSPPTAA